MGDDSGARHILLRRDARADDAAVSVGVGSPGFPRASAPLHARATSVRARFTSHAAGDRRALGRSRRDGHDGDVRGALVVAPRAANTPKADFRLAARATAATIRAHLQGGESTVRSDAWAQLGFELTGEDTYEQVALLLLYNMDALSSEVLDELNVRPIRASVGGAVRKARQEANRVAVYAIMRVR